jgi:hypothetical protein
MKSNIVYLIDENEEQRRAYALVLGELLDGTGLVIEPLAPLPTPDDYAPLLATGSVVALILDQKLEDGGVAYSGTQLSGHLRGIAPKLPIFIISNYTNDPELFKDGEGDVEYIIAKKVINDPTSRDAQIFKARFIRRLGVFADVLNERTQRYHNLLVKSLSESLTNEEEKELGLLETERAIPQQATEIRDIKALEDAIAELRSRMNPNKTSLK